MVLSNLSMVPNSCLAGIIIGPCCFLSLISLQPALGLVSAHISHKVKFLVKVILTSYGSFFIATSDHPHIFLLCFQVLSSLRSVLL